MNVSLRALTVLLAASALACAGAGPRPAATSAEAAGAASEPSRDPVALAAAGEAALGRNAFADAERLLREATKLAPGDARASALLAVAVFQQARFDEALGLARASLEKGETYDARLVEGRVSAIRRRLDDALRAYERCAALRPDSAEAWSAVAAARLATGDSDGAARAWDELARVEDPVKLPLKAEDRVWTDILRVQPDPHQVQEALDRSARGTAAYLAGKYEEAAHEIQAAVGSFPQFAHAWSELGKAYARSGRHADAERAFRTALAAYRPDQAGLKADTQALLARFLLDQKKDASGALALARAAKEVRGDRPDVVAVLEQACARTKDPTCAKPVPGPRAPAAAEAAADPKTTATR